MTPLTTLRKLSAAISTLGAQVIGRWQWQPPAWLMWIGSRLAQAARYLAADAKRAAIVLLVLAGAVGGWVWYKSRPVPHYVTYTLTAPGLTEYDEKGISSIKPLAVRFSESAAHLQQVDKTVTAGIGLSPKMPGAWHWLSDKDLEDIVAYLVGVLGARFPGALTWRPLAFLGRHSLAVGAPWPGLQRPWRVDGTRNRSGTP